MHIHNVTIPANIRCIVLTNSDPIPLPAILVYVPLSSGVNPLLDNTPVILFTVNLPPVVIVSLFGPVQVTVGTGLPLTLANKNIVTKLPDWIYWILGPTNIASAETRDTEYNESCTN